MKSNLTDPGRPKVDLEKRVSVLENAKLYHLKDNRPHIFVSSKFTTIQSDHDTNMHSLEGRTFSSKRKRIDFSAKKAYFRKEGNKLILQEEVVLTNDDSNWVADELTYYRDRDEVTGEGNVMLKATLPNSQDRVEIKANKFSYLLEKKISNFYDDVKGNVHRKEKYREGIDFKSDKLTYAQLKSKIELAGAVYLNKPPFSAWSNSGEIYLNNYSNKLNYFVLNDDVKLREKKKFGLRKAFAEKMEGKASEGKLILTGFPKVIQDGEVIKGNKITIRENSEVVEVEDANTTFKIKKGQ